MNWVEMTINHFPKKGPKILAELPLDDIDRKELNKIIKRNKTNLKKKLLVKKI